MEGMRFVHFNTRYGLFLAVTMKSEGGGISLGNQSKPV